MLESFGRKPNVCIYILDNSSLQEWTAVVGSRSQEGYIGLRTWRGLSSTQQ